MTTEKNSFVVRNVPFAFVVGGKVVEYEVEATFSQTDNNTHNLTSFLVQSGLGTYTDLTEMLHNDKQLQKTVITVIQDNWNVLSSNISHDELEQQRNRT